MALKLVLLWLLLHDVNGSLIYEFVDEAIQRVFAANCLFDALKLSQGDVWILEFNKSMLATHKYQFSYQTFIFFNSSALEFAKLNAFCGNYYPLLVFIGCNYDEFEQIFKIIHRKLKVLVIVDKSNVLDDDDGRIFQWAADVNIYDFTLGIFEEDTKAVKFYTWFMFDKSSDCIGKVRPTLIRECRNGYDMKRALDFQEKSIFPKKITKAVSNCTLKIGWVTAPPFVIDPHRHENVGVYVAIFKLMAEMAGIKLHFHVRDVLVEDEFLNNGTINLLFNRTLNGDLDAILGFTFLGNDSRFSWGPIFGKEISRAVVRKAKPIAKHSQFVNAFESKSWLVIFLFYLIGVFAYSLITAETAIALRKPIEISEILLNVLKLTLNQSMSINFQHLSYRLFLAFYLVYAIVLNAVYFGKVSRNFGTSDTELKLQDLLTIHTNGFAAYFDYHLYIIETTYNNPETYHSTALLFKLNITSYDVYRRVSRAEIDACGMYLSVIEAYKSEKMAVDVLPYGVKFETTKFDTYVLRKNSHLNSIVNFWATEALEKGFYRHYFDKVAQDNINYTLLRNDDKIRNDPVPLTIWHFEQIFYVMCCGYLFAAFVFILEFVWHHCQKKLYQHFYLKYQGVV